MTAAPALQLSREQIVDLIEQQARQRRGLSARQLIMAYRESRLDKPADVADRNFLKVEQSSCQYQVDA